MFSLSYESLFPVHGPIVKTHLEKTCTGYMEDRCFGPSQLSLNSTVRFLLLSVDSKAHAQCRPFCKEKNAFHVNCHMLLEITENLALEMELGHPKLQTQVLRFFNFFLNYSLSQNVLQSPVF